MNRSNLENVKIMPFGYDDCFVTHGSVNELEKEKGMNADSIVEKIISKK